MPRGYCKDYRLDDMQSRLQKLIKKNHITQKDLASAWDVSQPRVSQKINNLDITIPELLKILDMAHAADEDLLRIFSKGVNR